MNATLRTALVIGGLIVVASAVGAGLFVWSSSQVVTWFVLIGIPLIVVSGIAVYVRGVVARSGTSEGQFVKQRARNVAEEFKDVIRETNDLRTAYPSWSPAVDARFESIQGEFRTQGVTFDLESGAYDLSKSASNAELQEFERLSAEIEGLRETVEEEFWEFVDKEVRRTTDSLDRLVEVGLIDEPSLPSPPAPSATTPECRDILEDGRREASDELEAAKSTVREMSRGKTRANDVDAIGRELTDAETAIEAVDYDAAVEAILEARDQLREQFSGDFEIERDVVLDLIEAVEDVGIEEFVDVTYIDQIREVESVVTDLDSGLDLAELTRRRSQLRQACTDAIAAMQRDLTDDVRTLHEVDLPPGYYNEPGVADENHVEELEEIDDLDRFTRRWQGTAADLVEALDTASTKTAVVEAYDDVAETIETELERTGSVTGAELPVRHADQFFGLYYRRNPSVEFDPEEPAVRQGDVETYAVKVTVTYETGGPTRTATVELLGSGYEARKTVETRVAGVVSFEDVPAGTLSLEATPGEEAFGRIEREVDVAGNESLEIEFAERSLLERVCSDVDTDLEEHLPQLQSRLESLYEEEGYISTSTELPVRQTHADCLLAIWAERTGRDAVQADEEVIVYDRDQLERELTNVVRYNIEPGSSLSFERLERNFLTAPVPPAVVQDVVATIETEYSVRTTDSTLEVE